MAEFVYHEPQVVNIGDVIHFKEEDYYMADIMYVQWYPYDNCSGYYIENPSEDALEKFYENVNASDPYHRSFVLILKLTKTHNNLNMRTIDEYIQHELLVLKMAISANGMC